MTCPSETSSAQTFNFPLNSQSWQVNGNAAISTSTIKLAGSAVNQRGSIFYKTAYSLPNLAFSTSFSFKIQSNSQGYGIAFVLGTSTTSLGTKENLGYGGTPSLGVLFKTKTTNSIEIVTNEDTTITEGDTTSKFDNGATWRAWVDYDGVTLYLRYSQTINVRPSEPNFVTKLDLSYLEGKPIYFGFSGGSGSSTALHEILGPIKFSSALRPIEQSCPIGSYYSFLTGDCIECPEGSRSSSTGLCCVSCPTDTKSSLDRSQCIGIYFFYIQFILFPIQFCTCF